MEAIKRATQKELNKLWKGIIRCLNFNLKIELEDYLKKRN